MLANRAARGREVLYDWPSGAFRCVRAPPALELLFCRLAAVAVLVRVSLMPIEIGIRFPPACASAVAVVHTVEFLAHGRRGEEQPHHHKSSLP